MDRLRAGNRAAVGPTGPGVAHGMNLKGGMVGFGRIFDLVRGSLTPIRLSAGSSSGPPKPPDIGILRPDPSAMYLLGDTDRGPHGPPEQEEGLGPVANVVRAPQMKLQARWRAFERLVSRTERDQAKRLCRLLAPSDWASLYAVFTAAVVEAIEARPERWRRRDEGLLPGWFTEPWYALDVRPRRVAQDLDRVHQLGFENVFLQEDFAAQTPFIESLLDTAGERDLRVVMGVELKQAALAGLSRDAQRLAEVLGLLAREVNLGVLGAEAHHPDRWAALLAGDTRAHALCGLMKLFMHLVGPRETVVLDVDVPASDAVSWFGGWMQVDGEPFSGEGDLVRWREGAEALRETLRSGVRTPLEAALYEVPAVGRHGAFLVSLEETVESVLGAALLYFLPATPVVEHGAASDYLATLNAVRRTRAALSGGGLAPMDLPDDRTLAWVRTRPDSEPLLLLANLHTAERRLVLDADMLSEAMEIPVEAGDVLHTEAGDPEPTGRWISVPPGGRLEIPLPARGHLILSSPIRVARRPILRAA